MVGGRVLTRKAKRRRLCRVIKERRKDGGNLALSSFLLLRTSRPTSSISMHGQYFIGKTDVSNRDNCVDIACGLRALAEYILPMALLEGLIL